MKTKEEIVSQKHFEFGRNWSAFLEVLKEDHIINAEKSLMEMLGVENLLGKTFLDIGSGSGLSSLAALRLGATRVYSFDYDIHSVACTDELKRRFFNDEKWTVQTGNVLDREYIETLGRFDVVYSWGVLHHTGAMWEAFENVLIPINEKGKLFIAIYNDQGRASHYWKIIKKIYNRLPGLFKNLLLAVLFVRIWGPTIIRDTMRLKPTYTWRAYKQNRGMSPWHDVVDWVGGYPFEVAKPEDIFNFFYKRGFILDRLKTCGGGIGCNEFVFKKNS